MPIDSNDLNWWHAEDGFMLRYGRRAQVIVRVVQEDSIYPNMWRVEFVDRTLSDISQPPYVRARARARGACLFLTDRGNAGPSVGFCRAQDNEPLSTSNNDNPAARCRQTQFF